MEKLLLVIDAEKKEGIIKALEAIIFRISRSTYWADYRGGSIGGDSKYKFTFTLYFDDYEDNHYVFET